METSSNKLRTVASKLTLANTDDPSRAFDIKATFNHCGNGTGGYGGGQIESGEVTTKENRTAVATFSAWNGESLNVNFTTSANRAAIMAAIEDFIAGGKEYMSSLAVNN